MTCYIEIDPNVRIEGNQTCAGFEDCSYVPDVGESVVVYESEFGAAGPAVVTRIAFETHMVLLSLDWGDIRTDHADGEAIKRIMKNG